MMPSGPSAEPGFLTSRLFIWWCCCCCWFSFAFAMVVGQHRTTLDRITSGTPAGSWDDSSLSKPEEATSSFDASSLIRFGAYRGGRRSEKVEEQFDGMLGSQDRMIRRDPSENDVQKILRETISVKRPVNVTSSSSESPWKQADVQTVAGEEDARWMRTQDDDGAAKVKQLPQAIIIGVKKGGTRALLEFLRTHPDVRATGPEIHFFDKNYKKGLEWYRSHMPTTMSGQITVEKTPSYWITKNAPSRIHNMSTTVRLIVVVRDPTTRALSDYTQAISKRPNLGSFEQMAFISNTTRMVDTSWGAIRIGVYCRHLARWLEYFPLKQIHFVNGERLISDPAGELATVQDFLGLKRVVTQKHFYFNATKGFPCLKKSERSGVPHCLGKTKGRTHPAVDPYVLRRLREFYRPFNQKFYQMTGIDFGWP